LLRNATTYNLNWLCHQVDDRALLTEALTMKLFTGVITAAFVTPTSFTSFYSFGYNLILRVLSVALRRSFPFDKTKLTAHKVVFKIVNFVHF
jgi:hypothetical protein